MPSVTAGSPHASPYARACGCELLNIACMRILGISRIVFVWNFNERQTNHEKGLAAVCGSPFFCAVTKLGRGAHVNYVISLERICVALRSTICYVILKINMYARTIIH